MIYTKIIFWALEQKNKVVEDLKSQLNAINAEKATWQSISNELSAQYPQIREIYLSTANQWRKGDLTENEELLVLNIKTASKLSKDDVYRITEWLKVRVGVKEVKIVIE